MTGEDWSAFARKKGFAEAYFVSVQPFSRWEQEARRQPAPQYAGLHADPRECMPEAQSLMVLVWPYRPYGDFPSGEISIDAYYPASQSAYQAAGEIAEQIRQEGYRADASPAIPAKQALMRTGEAKYGRNGLLSLSGFGTRFVLQLILTDMPMHVLDCAPESEMALDCEGCGRCLIACPVSALPGNSRVLAEKCIRGQSYSAEMPGEYRQLLGNHLLGCDLCQRVCPRNAGVFGVAPPPELCNALALEKLLAGETKALAQWIGKNYARPVRMQGRAALLAANLGRNDLIPQLAELAAQHPFAFVRAHARWAVNRLRG